MKNETERDVKTAWIPAWVHDTLMRIARKDKRKFEGVLEDVLITGMKVKRILPTEEGK